MAHIITDIKFLEIFFDFHILVETLIDNSARLVLDNNEAHITRKRKREVCNSMAYK